MKANLFPNDFSKSTLTATYYSGVLAKNHGTNLTFLYIHYMLKVQENASPFNVKNVFSLDEKVAKEHVSVGTKNLIQNSNVVSGRITQRVRKEYPDKKTIETTHRSKLF